MRPISRRTRGSARFRPVCQALEARQLLAVDVLTYHDNNSRTGWNPNETALTPADVNSSTFGKLFNASVDGKVDAQPLIKTAVTIPGQGVHDVLYVATEHDSVYAFDADTGGLLWKVSLLGPGETPADDRGSGQVTPEIGITATPVIDPATNTMYVVAMSKLVANGATTYFQRIHALDITTGADKVAPKSIDSSITYPGKGPGGNGTVVAFNPAQYKERDALLLVGGVVYTSWASHSDIAPYTGWMMGFDASTLQLKTVLNIDPNGIPTSSFLPDGSGNTFWNSGAGPAADSSGNLYNISANGPFDPNLEANGFPVSRDFGDSILKFSTSGGLAVADYFTPYNQQAEANADEDMGSSGLLLVDVPNGQGSTIHLAVGSGKDGNIYVVDRNNMGKFNSAGNSNIYQELPSALGGAEFGAPAYFNGTVYFGARDATLRAFAFSGGKLATTPSSQTSLSFSYPGTTPSVSSNGNTDGVVWAAENGTTAVLHAYDATNLADELYNSNQAANGRDHFGTGNKFITPVVANGKVYVATTSGVGVFGLLSDTTQPPSLAMPASASPNPVAGTSTTLSALGSDPNFSEGTLKYTWTTLAAPSGAPAQTFSSNGANAAKSTTVSFGAAGSYTFQVTVADPNGRSVTGTVPVTVNQTLTSLSVSPAMATVSDGGFTTFVASGRDQFGAPIGTPPAVAWQVGRGGLGTVTPSGVYVAPASGSGLAVVLASSGPVLGFAIVTVVAPAPVFSAHVNFSDNLTQVPTGYVNDVGLPFGPRGPGLAFGWNVNNTANGRDRDNPVSPSELYDSFVQMQGGRVRNAAWSISVPDGIYLVHLIAGDPNSTAGRYRIAVQGTLALAGQPTRMRHWVETSVVVRVANGLLTVSNAQGAVGNKIDAVDITQLPGDVDTAALGSGSDAARPPLTTRTRVGSIPRLARGRRGGS